MQRMSTILREAFDILERDQPPAYFRVTDELDGLTVRLLVDDESFEVQCAFDRVRIADSHSDSEFSAAAVTSARTVLDLCDGQVRLLEAVLAGRLDVQAREDRLLRMSRAVTAFSEGAVRARRMRALLDEFRAQFTRG